MKSLAKPVRTGIDLFEKKWPGRLKGARIGLLVHPASINRVFKHTVDHLSKYRKCRLSALFGPQHGIRGETQDNMIEWEGFRDKNTGMPIFSLYGQTRKPYPEMLEEIDVLAIDLQDIGARYYTFVWTMELCMQACMETKKSVVLFDRPNPIGGHITEGPILDQHYSSFVGQRPLPIRHGMTIGEMGTYLHHEYYPSLDFHVIPMDGWKRKMWFDETGLPWIMPSPNMPALDTAIVYPGMCLLEGTNISEGRGTTRPFEIFGAPFIDPDTLVNHLMKSKLPGVIFRPIYFQPTFQKHIGRLCGGAQIHISDRDKFRPFKTGVAVIKAIRDLYPRKFAWKQPPYEYEFTKMPIDVLAGTDRLRRDIESSVSLELMEAWWQEECREFESTVRKRYLIYK
jgi:uncharacterized protein YbbC (DUF1343 family)